MDNLIEQIDRKKKEIDYLRIENDKLLLKNQELIDSLSASSSELVKKT